MIHAPAQKEVVEELVLLVSLTFEDYALVSATPLHSQCGPMCSTWSQWALFLLLGHVSRTPNLTRSECSCLL